MSISHAALRVLYRSFDLFREYGGSSAALGQRERENVFKRTLYQRSLRIYPRPLLGDGAHGAVAEAGERGVKFGAGAAQTEYQRGRAKRQTRPKLGEKKVVAGQYPHSSLF